MRNNLRPTHALFRAVFSFIKSRSRLVSGFLEETHRTCYQSIADKMTRAGFWNHFPAVGQGESGVNVKVNMLSIKMSLCQRDKLTRKYECITCVLQKRVPFKQDVMVSKTGKE